MLTSFRVKLHELRPMCKIYTYEWMMYTKGIEGIFIDIIYLNTYIMS